jgi:hypothetical protein
MESRIFTYPSFGAPGVAKRRRRPVDDRCFRGASSGIRSGFVVSCNWSHLIPISAFGGPKFTLNAIIKTMISWALRTSTSYFVTGAVCLSGDARFQSRDFNESELLFDIRISCIFLHKSGTQPRPYNARQKALIFPYHAAVIPVRLHSESQSMSGVENRRSG